MHQNVSLGSNGLDWFCSLQTILMRFRGTDFCTSSARFAPSFIRQPNIPNAPKWYEMHQNISLGSNGVDRVPSLQKIPTRQTAPNAPKWYKTHQNIILGSNGVDRVRLLRNIPTRLRGTNFWTSSARLAPSFVRQPNGLECTQIVQNAPKHQFGVQWGGLDAFVVKNSDATSRHELLH